MTDKTSKPTNKSTATTNKTPTAYELELLKAAKKVKEYKLACEANIVAIFYKNSDSMYDYNLALEDFSDNTWKVYWQIAYDIVIKEKKPSLDEITVGLYLEKHDKLRQKYEEYKGYETIEKAEGYVKVENLDGYVKDLNKWNAVLKLLKRRFPVYDRISEFADMSTDEIYAEYDAELNHIFINADDDVKSYSIDYQIHELVEELDLGMAVGLPYADMPMLNKELGGDLVGTITLEGALSNIGKSTFVRSTKIPSVLKYNERLVVMLNEEDYKKWQREFLVWVANNIFKEDLQKYIVRDGKYSKEVKELLHKCADWIQEKASNNIITIIPFKKYQTSQAIKIIKKYASLGVKYFVLDTFKADSGQTNEQMWLSMQQSMVDINDTIKPASKNVHITITFQLAKTSARQRFYTQDNVGMAKNIIDPVSTTIMIRDFFDDELPNGKNELKVYRLEGKNGKSKIPVTLNPDKHYQIIFIVKSREGGKDCQIVIEHDLSRNIIKEIGICHVMQDF